jgi:hypothetical protein
MVSIVGLSPTLRPEHFSSSSKFSNKSILEVFLIWGTCVAAHGTAATWTMNMLGSFQCCDFHVCGATLRPGNSISPSGLCGEFIIRAASTHALHTFSSGCTKYSSKLFQFVLLADHRMAKRATNSDS